MQESTPTKPTREELHELFVSHPQVIVTFTKKDGSERVLRGTLNESLIPVEKHPKGLRESYDTVFTVFDLDEDDWRCFKLDSIISAEPNK